MIFESLFAGSLVFPGINFEVTLDVDVASLLEVLAAGLGAAVPDGDVNEECFFLPFAILPLPAAVHRQTELGDGRAAGDARSSGSNVSLPIKKTLFRLAIAGCLSPEPAGFAAPGLVS